MEGGIVELTVPEGWPIHITWAAMALAITAQRDQGIECHTGLGQRKSLSLPSSHQRNSSARVDFAI
jgi:hypothetical protein